MDQAAKDAEPGKGTERDGMEMKDGLLSIVVLPKGEAEKEWVERFKKEREASKKS